MTRFIAAVDPKPTSASLAMVFEDNRTPTISVTKFGSPTEEEFHPAAAQARATACAERIVKKIVANGEPEMVVMSKLILSDINKDPSGARRAALWWETVRLFNERGIPVAEIAPMTAQAMLSAFPTRGGKTSVSGFEMTKRAVLKLYPAVEDDLTGFWYFTLALALAGAHVLAWDTPLAPSYDNLRALRASKGVSLPNGVTVPRDVEDWTRRNEAQKVAV
ncbi:hypothetical protein P3F83_07785 [Mycobacteroides immunogenum]|uniref:hypothetical protein n=1 Tax=Mycobacteroides immunogenum TaxID=83262 RepID=UPI0025B799EA|nr:hypothetical protein [Mycobacteroides immunogenum]WJR35261.1 hypothetical protein P3F83_07785 [Mycobacteroides immunogenum]